MHKAIEVMLNDVQVDDQFMREIHILYEKLDQNYLFQAQIEKL